MSRKNHQPPIGQEGLFVGDGESRPIATWQEIEENPLIKSPYIIGDPNIPQVDIQTRAESLLEAATKQGYANQRQLGLQDAVKIEPYSTEIWGRLKGRTNRTVEGARKNASTYEGEAKRAFWKATGLEVLIAAGMMEREEAKALGRVWYRRFNSRFSGDDKPKQKGGLKKQITAQKRLKKRQAKEEQQAA